MIDEKTEKNNVMLKGLFDKGYLIIQTEKDGETPVKPIKFVLDHGKISKDKDKTLKKIKDVENNGKDLHNEVEKYLQNIKLWNLDTDTKKEAIVRTIQYEKEICKILDGQIKSYEEAIDSMSWSWKSLSVFGKKNMKERYDMMNEYNKSGVKKLHNMIVEYNKTSMKPIRGIMLKE